MYQQKLTIHRQKLTMHWQILTMHRQILTMHQQKLTTHRQIDHTQAKLHVKLTMYLQNWLGAGVGGSRERARWVAAGGLGAVGVGVDVWVHVCTDKCEGILTE